MLFASLPEPSTSTTPLPLGIFSRAFQIPGSSPRFFCSQTRVKSTAVISESGNAIAAPDTHASALLAPICNTRSFTPFRHLPDLTKAPQSPRNQHLLTSSVRQAPKAATQRINPQHESETNKQVLRKSCWRLICQDTYSPGTNASTQTRTAHPRPATLVLDPAIPKQNTLHATLLPRLSRPKADGTPTGSGRSRDPRGA